MNSGTSVSIPALTLWSNRIAQGTDSISDPLPQALSLTAIVISFGLTLFLLALARRQNQLTGDDLVEDDLEDRRIAGQS